MNNTLHIVSGFAAAGTLKSFFRKTDIHEEILTFVDPLKQGPLFKDFSDQELIKRKQTLEELFGIYPDFDYYANSRAFRDHDFDKYEKVVIWHGNDVDELLFLYMASSLIKRDLHEVNCIEIRDTFPHLPQEPFILPFFCCSDENVTILYDKIKPISPETKQDYISNWNKWSKSEAPIRILDKNYTIQEVDENYFDEVLLSNCPSEFEPVARAIGKTLWNINFLAGDSFLHRRIIHLIGQKKLAICRNEEFAADIEKSDLSDENKRVVDQVNVTELRFFSIKLIG